MTIWCGTKPLILASKSAARQELLANAGIAFEAIPAEIDERAIQLASGLSAPGEIAALLAREKAVSVSLRHPNDFIIGSDQTLECDGKVFSKPTSVADARLQLIGLRGRTHRLHSAVTLAHKNNVIWSMCESVTLTMRNFSDQFLDTYLETEKSEILHCVGAYRFEGPGIQLFDQVEGNYHVILGMPVLPLLQKLREHGLIAS